MKKVACPLFLFVVLIVLQKVACPLFAEDMTGTNYKLKQGTFCVSGFSGGSASYNLQDIVGVNTGELMLGSQYAINPGFYNLNSLPVASLASYNDGRPTDDATPTLQWTYSDAENDTQKRYQVQVGRIGFDTPVVDSGLISSFATAFTTPVLPSTEERTLYRWRVRVDDGFGWSGWVQSEHGFILTKGVFEIANLRALTAPGAGPITESSWQTDNDPYFLWDAPAIGLEVLGYSCALDEAPDDEINTRSTFFYFSLDSIADGIHTFYVKAQRSSGVWGEAASFNIWVDTLPPTVSYLVPALGGVIANDKPEIGAELSDAASGINPDSIQLRLNQARVYPQYNPQTGKITFVPTIPLSEGELIVSLEASDSVGNYGLPLTWSFIIDTEGPTGSVTINNGDEVTTTNVVTLNIAAEDAHSLVCDVMLSNDGIFDTEIWEPYAAIRKNWLLPAINGIRKVYVLLKDEAGNISEALFDDINLVIIAPETYILSGPSGITQSPNPQFTFRGSLSGCQFSYKFDDEDWSEWSAADSVSKSGLSEGNHYFMVRAAKDLNKDGILQLDEVDPTAAQRVWTISPTGAFAPPAVPKKPIKYWEEE